MKEQQRPQTGVARIAGPNSASAREHGDAGHQQHRHQAMDSPTMAPASASTAQKVTTMHYLRQQIDAEHAHGGRLQQRAA